MGQDDRTLAAVTMGQEDGKFQSFLVLYHTDSSKMVATTPVDGGVAYALETLHREFCAVTEQGLYLLDSGGELKASYSYGRPVPAPLRGGGRRLGRAAAEPV